MWRDFIGMSGIQQSSNQVRAEAGATLALWQRGHTYACPSGAGFTLVGQPKIIGRQKKKSCAPRQHTT
jgi:hypothetical protein